MYACVTVLNFLNASPTVEWSLQVWSVGCAVVRGKINTYDRRGSKLRSIDYVAQCVGIKQEYHTSSALDAVIECCKKETKEMNQTQFQ